MSMLNFVSLMCSVFAVVTFGLYVYQVIIRMRGMVRQVEGDRADSVQQHGAVADMGKLLEAFAKLSDSLEKAGPLTGSLVGSMFFAVLAALTAGLAK
jgi:hypothetical protein